MTEEQKKIEEFEKLKSIIFDVANAIAQSYVEAILDCNFPQTLKDEIYSKVPYGVNKEEILAMFPLFQGPPRLDKV